MAQYYRDFMAEARELADGEQRQITWRDEQTGLECVLEMRTCAGFPAGAGGLTCRRLVPILGPGGAECTRERDRCFPRCSPCC